MKRSQEVLALNDLLMGPGLGAFEAGLEDVLASGSWGGTLDWKAVTGVSIRGLVVLAALARRYQTQGGTVSCVHLAPGLKEQLELLGFDHRYLGKEA